MSYTFRPTPVVRLLSGHPTVTGPMLRGLPAGVMQGYAPNPSYKALNDLGRRTLAGDPWLISSGSMGKFMTLGDDSIDTTSIDLPSTLTPPDFTPLPNLLIPVGLNAPIDTTPMVYPSTLTPPAPVTYQTPGVTGALPVTITSAGGQIAAIQNPSTLQNQNPIQSIVSSISSIFGGGSSNAVKPVAVPTGAIALGQPQPSWFTQSTVLPGFNNTTVLFGGIALLALVAAMAIGRK